jgi:hypothetical protein
MMFAEAPFLALAVEEIFAPSTASDGVPLKPQPR